MATYDIVIRNGQVADGTGKKLFAADVALKGDRIAAVDAPGALKGDNEIDAKGKVVAPGFIDVHTHDDTALIDNPTMAMKASQGVTTVVCGNCGASAAPYIRDDVGHFLSLIVRNKANISKSFAEFAGKVDAAKPAINGAFLIGHSTLRMNFMGDDLARTATAGEITGMRDLLDQSLEQGAIGMSSGLFYAVANAASTDEVAEVAKPLGKWGGVYTAHMRDEGENILPAMDETFEIGRRAGASIIVSHHKCSGRTNFGRMKETLPKFTEAMKQQQIAFDVYPYIAGSTILRSDMLERADKVLITWSDKVAGLARPRSQGDRPGDGLLHARGGRPHPAGRRHLLHDGREGRAERHGPSRRHDRLGRHPLRRPSPSAPVGHVSARAGPLLARAEAVPAGGRGAAHDVVLGPALRARQARRDQAGLLCRHLRVRSGDGDRHGDLREADLGGQGHRRGAVQRRRSSGATASPAAAAPAARSGGRIFRLRRRLEA